MTRAKDVVFWGMLAVLGFLGAKRLLAGVAGSYRTGRGAGLWGNVRGGGGPDSARFQGLGRADAYTDAFPEDGLDELGRRTH